MKLPIRLNIIASLVKKGVIVYDIGCDHALLDIFLTTYNNNTCIASDINKNALNSAISNIKKYNLENKIETVLSDGVKNIDIKKNSTCIISGMGTSTILEILKDKKFDVIDELIIQSNNDYYMLRSNITKEYIIKDELMVFEKGKYYLILKLIHGKKKYSKYDLEYGPILRKNPTLESLMYFELSKKTKYEILKKIPNKYIIKKIKLYKEIKYLNRILKKNDFKGRK